MCRCAGSSSWGKGALAAARVGLWVHVGSGAEQVQRHEKRCAWGKSPRGALLQHTRQVRVGSSEALGQH